eukprot:scaffold319095_cov18-Prasinocladus_malaysianus.AAC.1
MAPSGGGTPTRQGSSSYREQACRGSEAAIAGASAVARVRPPAASQQSSAEPAATGNHANTHECHLSRSRRGSQ